MKLRRGMSNEHVVQIQLLLNRYFGKRTVPIKADGKFGSLTEIRVRKFQTENKIEPDGIVGNKTRHALGLKPTGQVLLPKPIVGKSWIDIAAAEVGVSGDIRPGEHNKRIIEYLKTTTVYASDADETPWCSAFVNWVVTQSGRTGTNNALAASWLTWGKKLEKPVDGCIVVVRKKVPGAPSQTTGTGNHVGFFRGYSDQGKKILILGGNQRNAVNQMSWNLASYEVRGFVS